MSRESHIPHIRPLDLAVHRQVIPQVHAYLRSRILDGTIAADTRISQVALAKQLGVSRTPLREALRRLQDEGLVDIAPNQRTRVAGLDPHELDEIYAGRIVLEALAMSLTVGNFDRTQAKLAGDLLGSMRKSAAAGDLETWFVSHADFHRTITSGAGPTLQRQLCQHADRAIRYIRTYQIGDPRSWQTSGDQEHADILSSLVEENAPDAMSRLAHHFARTALRVLTDCAPEYKPVAVPRAIALVERAAAHVNEGIAFE